MPLLRFEQVAQYGKVAVGRIEQPEVGDVGCGKVGQTLVLLAAHAGDGAGARSEQFHQAAGDGH